MKENQTLINILLDCAIACENCANKSQVENNLKSVQLYRDCVDLCKQAIRLINHNSEITGQYLSLCEEMFKICAQECVKCNPDAAMYLQQCAEACLKTADAVHNYRAPSRELIAA
ncbi:MAG TPA: hypothetical protein VF691_05380 [Cytophagaceae bacterium]|jgi:hypothetical protein